jgi:hypothetical protein
LEEGSVHIHNLPQEKGMTKDDLKQYVMNRANKNYGQEIKQEVFTRQLVGDALIACPTALSVLPDLVAARIVRTLVQYQLRIDQVRTQRQLESENTGEIIGPEEFLIEFGDSILDLEARALAAGLEETHSSRMSRRVGKVLNLVGISK